MNQVSTIACYLRTSREFKNHEKVSIAQQSHDAQITAKGLGGTISEDLVFIDADFSSTIPPQQYAPTAKKIRPALTALLDAVHAGKVRTVIVRKRDRLSRPLEQTLWIYRFLDDHGVRLVATHEAGFGNDAAGNFSMKTLALVAEFELERIRENVKASKTYAKNNGLKICGVTTPGYMDGARGKVAVHDADAAVMRECFERIANGASFTGVCRWLNEEHKDMLARIRNGGRFWFQSVRNWLTNPRYIGLCDDGQPCKNFPAIINPDLFYRVQEIFKKRRTGKVRWTVERHILTGYLICEYCGTPMIIGAAKMAHSWQRVYRCRCREERHEQWPVMIREAEWIRFVETLFIRPEPGYRAKWSFMRTDRKSADNPERNSLRVHLSNLDEKLEHLAKNLSNGKLDVNAYTVGSAHLNTTKARLQAKLASMPENSGNTVDKAWDECTHDEKHELVGETIKEIRVFKRHIDVVLTTSATLRFPVMRLVPIREHGVGRPCNALLPRDVASPDEIMLVLEHQFKCDGKVNHNEVATMDWTDWVSKSFYAPKPTILKRDGETPKAYAARYQRARRAA
jgi:DNA invertase Pin-like site-specific DNA recombinase